MGAALIRGLAMGGLYGLLAISIALVHRATGAMSFAHGELGGVGALVTWWALEQMGQPWFIAAGFGIVTAGAIGAAFDRTVVRRVAAEGGTGNVTIATVALLSLLLTVELRGWGVYPRVLEFPIGFRGVEIFGTLAAPAQILALVAGPVLAFGITVALRRTSIGLATLAVAHDRGEAALLGLPVGLISTGVWAVTAAMAAVAALLFAPVIGAIGAGTMTFFFLRSIAAVVIGGTTTMTGPFLGGLAVGIVEQIVVQLLLSTSIPGGDVLAVFALLVIALAVRGDRGLRTAT